MRLPSFAALLMLVCVPVAAAQAPAIEPCALLTRAEIKAATGLAVSQMALSSRMDPAVGSLCDFKLGDLGYGGIVVHQLRPGETRDTMMAELQKQKVECVDAPRLGVPSFFASPGYGLVQLNSFKGPTQVIVQLFVFGKTNTDAMAATEKLMRSALTRVK